jgi:hypothetical protein
MLPWLSDSDAGDGTFPFPHAPMICDRRRDALTICDRRRDGVREDGDWDELCHGGGRVATPPPNGLGMGLATATSTEPPREDELAMTSWWSGWMLCSGSTRATPCAPPNTSWWSKRMKTYLDTCRWKANLFQGLPPSLHDNATMDGVDEAIAFTSRVCFMTYLIATNIFSFLCDFPSILFNLGAPLMPLALALRSTTLHQCRRNPSPSDSPSIAASRAAPLHPLRFSVMADPRRVGESSSREREEDRRGMEFDLALQERLVRKIDLLYFQLASPEERI